MAINTNAINANTTTPLKPLGGGSGVSNSDASTMTLNGAVNIQGAYSFDQSVAQAASPTFSALSLTAPLIGTNGGTGVNNAARTITVAGNLETIGAFATTFTMTAATNVTFPLSGTLTTTASASGIVNSGLINQLAYYAAAGTTLSGLAIVNSAGLTTTAGGVPTWVSATGSDAPVFATSPTLVTPIVSTTIGVGGATPSASGSGITFPATQSESANANTLDDYEEGTWTPGFSFGDASVGITYGPQFGFYVKIGRLVTLNCYVALLNKGSSTGVARLTGIPFQCIATGFSVTSLRPVNITFADFPTAYVEPGQTSIRLEEVTNSGVMTSLTNSDFSNNSETMLTVSYSAS